MGASQVVISRERILDISNEDWDFITDVALDGVRQVTQELAPAMNKYGSIINISSPAAPAARLSMADLPAYAAAKGGVETFIHASAKELALGIRVNTIAPSFIITPQNKETHAEGTEKRIKIDERALAGRVAEREGIVEAAVYLGSDALSYVTGEVLTVDGGFADSAL